MRGGRFIECLIDERMMTIFCSLLFSHAKFLTTGIGSFPPAGFFVGAGEDVPNLNCLCALTSDTTSVRTFVQFSHSTFSILFVVCTVWALQVALACTIDVPLLLLLALHLPLNTHELSLLWNEKIS